MAERDIRLKNLETRLNKDTKLLAEFMKNPVGILENENIKLTPQMEAAINEQFKLLRSPAIQSLGIRPKINITIRPIGIQIIIPLP